MMCDTCWHVPHPTFPPSSSSLSLASSPSSASLSPSRTHILDIFFFSLSFISRMLWHLVDLQFRFLTTYLTQQWQSGAHRFICSFTTQRTATTSNWNVLLTKSNPHPQIDVCTRAQCSHSAAKVRGESRIGIWRGLIRHLQETCCSIALFAIIYINRHIKNITHTRVR